MKKVEFLPLPQSGGYKTPSLIKILGESPDKIFKILGISLTLKVKIANFRYERGLSLEPQPLASNPTTNKVGVSREDERYWLGEGL